MPETHNSPRIFLVVLDDTPEMPVALRFAARRAEATGGRVALFACMDPPDFGHWQAVDELFEREQRREIEDLLLRYADQVNALTGQIPALYIRYGNRRDELLQLLEDDPAISILVLAASGAGRGPGPLISALTGKFRKKLRVPLTMVPGTLSDEAIDGLSIGG